MIPFMAHSYSRGVQLATIPDLWFFLMFSFHRDPICNPKPCMCQLIVSEGSGEVDLKQRKWDPTLVDHLFAFLK